MTLSALIAETTARAGDFLAGVTDPAVARELTLDELTLEYPALNATQHAAIADGVIAALREDDFFGWEFCGNPFAESPERDDF